MNKFLFYFFTLTFFAYASPAQVILHAEPNPLNSTVKLDWNMVNDPGKTTYILTKSNDGNVWSQVVTDRILRKYAADDIFDYKDKSIFRGKIYYRLVIINAQNLVIAVS